MDFENSIKKFDCKCGKHHSCAIKHIIIKENALHEIAGLVSNYHHILITADKNTYEICGKEIENQCLNRTEQVYVFTDEKMLVPDENAIERLSSQLNEKTDLIIGIGSGVIQDICKYVSFKKDLPYFIVATAPSMDGYASNSAALIINNMKITYTTHLPDAIIADINILKNAPISMIKSGYGDIIGKFSCLNDWKLSAFINNEYFCDYVYSIISDMVNKIKDIGNSLLNREPYAVKTLTESLIGTGIAMAYVNNSRPASGSEHHLSHFFEVVGILNNEPYFLHGTDVAYSTVISQKIREKLISMSCLPNKKHFNEKIWEQEIRKIYTDAADGIIELQKNLGWHWDDKYEIYKIKWKEIQNILKEVPSSEELIQYLNSVNLSMEDFYNLYGKEKINNAVKYAMDLKNRYTVLWIYNELI